MTKFAFVLFFSPRLMENNGAPPLPNRFANAFIITIKGKHKPIAPNAYVPILGIREYRYGPQHCKEDSLFVLLTMEKQHL